MGSLRQGFQKSGFTLVELMVVVAIIGILSSVAVSNYNKFVSRSRQSEAKIALASAYTAEQSFFANEGSYTFCLRQAGFEKSDSKSYYMIGINSNWINALGPAGNGMANCTKWNTDGSCISNCQLNCCTVGGPASQSDSMWCPNAGIGSPGADCNAIAPAGNGLFCLDNYGVSGACYAKQTDFALGAKGLISSSGQWDQWQIDQNKNLVNFNSGI